jgi:hypothetical protein
MLKIYCYPLQQLSFLIGVLTEYGKPVILVGENGCGKTSIINDRIRTVCSGEVAEVLSLSIPANRYLYDICLLSCFIWKCFVIFSNHATTVSETGDMPFWFWRISLILVYSIRHFIFVFMPTFVLITCDKLLGFISCFVRGMLYCKFLSHFLQK